MKTVGLIAHGNSNWIAGVQYLQSLLYGNSLLPASQQGHFDLFLHKDIHCLSDYQSVLPYINDTYTFNYFPGRPLPLVRKGYQMLQQVRQKQWPHYPTDNFSKLITSSNVDIVFPANEVALHNTAYKQISWIPDFQHIYFPGYFTTLQLYKRNQDFERIMRRSDRVIVSNQYSYNDAVQLYPAYKHKLVILNFTMFLGEHWFQPDVSLLVRKYNLPAKYLMFPSQFWKHKNHTALFEAVHLARQKGLDNLVLVCTGHPHDIRFPGYSHEIQSILKRYQLTSTVRILGLLPRHDQIQLMRGAAAIIQPSLFEGWSALLEDCQSLGKTVFVSDIPMHQEQRTDRMFFFNPRSPESIADVLLQHWHHLQPGPDPDAEAIGAAGYYNRIQQFAKNFNSICQSTVNA
jgi:glycosyltransferase involved in cell wall biosynthesis